MAKSNAMNQNTANNGRLDRIYPTVGRQALLDPGSVIRTLVDRGSALNRPLIDGRTQTRIREAGIPIDFLPLFLKLGVALERLIKSRGRIRGNSPLIQSRPLAICFSNLL